MSGRTESGDRGWDPRESQAALFRSQDAMPIRPSYSSTTPTLRRWAGSALAPHVRLATFKPGEVQGVGVSLTSPLTNVSTTGNILQVQPPGTTCSVTNGGANDFCSTNQGPALPACSVWQSTAAGKCSIDTSTGGDSQYCSTGPNGSPNNLTPSLCSALNSASGSSCSTRSSGPAPNGMSCSTQSGSAGVVGTSCSTAGGSGQSCSTGVVADPNNGNQTNGSCSAQSQGNGSPDSGNTCSVSGSGVQGAVNKCSSDSNTVLFCSTASATSGDFCSVSNNDTNVQCTVIGTGQKGNCSCKTPSSGNSQCSVSGGAPYQGGVCPPP